MSCAGTCANGTIWKPSGEMLPGSRRGAGRARRRNLQSQSLGGLRRCLRRGLHHVVHELLEIFQPGGGNDNGIAPAADILRNPQKTAARIFFQGEHKSFPLDLDLVRLESLFINRWFGSSVRTAAVRRLTLV